MKQLTKNEKLEIIKRHTPKSKTLKNCICAGIIGGVICLVAELSRRLYLYLGVNKDDSTLLASLTIILLSGLATALGFFDRIGRHAGAGTLVPISGFSNSVVSGAIDSQSEGYISGVGIKIFSVAGPVILYATVSGVIYGLIIYIIGGISAVM